MIVFAAVKRLTASWRFEQRKGQASRAKGRIPRLWSPRISYSYTKHLGRIQQVFGKHLRAHRRVSLACLQIRGILGWADEVSRGSPAQVCRGVPVSVALLRLAAIAGHTACQSCVFASR